MRIYEHFNLKCFNAYQLVAFCSKACFPESINDLLKIYHETPDIPKIILGNGNNILLAKERYDELIIIFNGCFDKIEVNREEITAEAGATMLQMSEIALQHSLSGFEVFFDIPSSVGGAVVMNAGASGEEIKDSLVKVSYLDLADQQIKEIPRDEIEFEYRNSFFQKHADKIVLKAWFNLIPGNPSAIKTKMEDIKQKRWAKQPREYPNCGSVFKRPAGRFVGPMLDELGLKGYAVGGAKISEKHSGFIVNTGNATGKDILALIEYSRKRVKEVFNVDLEIEQRIL